MSRIVVTGATGNVGTSVVAALSADPRVLSVLGLARRRPAMPLPKVTWEAADIRTAGLEERFAGADAVIHLAWLIQPSHREDVLESVNVGGSLAVFDAAARAGVRTIVHASSVGTYAARTSLTPVTEDWPATGIPTCSYSRHKARVEQALDGFEARHPGVRVVRLRPALVFKRIAGAEVTGYFLGGWIRRWMVPARLPVVPLPSGLVLQAVHSHDLAGAYVAAALDPDARGAYNICGPDTIDADVVSQRFGARPVAVPPRLMRAAMSAGWRVRAQPTDPGWFDMAMGAPLMDGARAVRELGFRPRHSAIDSLTDILHGVRDQTGYATPALRPH